MAKVNISLDDELLEKIDALADESYTSRSGFISMGMTDFIKSKEIVSAITKMGNAMERIAVSNEIDEDTQKELAQIQAVIGLLARK